MAAKRERGPGAEAHRPDPPREALPGPGEREATTLRERDGSERARDATVRGAGAQLSCTVAVAEGAPPEHLFRQLVAAHLAGAGRIVLEEPHGLSNETRAIAATFQRRSGLYNRIAEAPGVLLLEEGEPRSGEPPEDLLERMFATARDMQRAAGARLGPEPRGELRELDRLDDEVDRDAWLVERALTRQLDAARARDPSGGAEADPLSPLLVARALERVADHAVTLGENAERLSECPVPEPVVAALRAYHGQALDYLASAFEVALAPEVDRANELIDTGEALLAAHATLTERFLVRAETPGLSPIAAAGLGLVLRSIDRTVAYAQDIAQVGLDRAIAGGLVLGGAAPHDARAVPRRVPARLGGPDDGPDRTGLEAELVG